jgi:hypothetical protein
VGTCLWHYVYPGILSQYEAVSLDSWQKFMVAVAPVLGVLSVVSTIDDIVNVIASTGFLTVAAVVIDVITAVLGYIISCPQKSKYTSNTIYYDFDLNQIAPLPAQFKRVEVTESSGTNGKTVYLFTHGDINASGDPQYYALWSAAGDNNNIFSSKQRFAPWAYGLPYLTTVYDANGNKIKEVQNNYEFKYAMRQILDPIYGVLCETHYSPVPVKSCKCQVVNNYSLRSDYWTSATPQYITVSNADMNVDIYKYYTGRVELTSTLERTYRVTDPTKFIENETDYLYNNADCDVLTNYTGQTNYEVNSISTLLSNGDAIIKDFTYPTNFNSGIFLTMTQKNIISTPVSVATRLMKNGNYTNFYLNEKVTEFTQSADGEVKPFRTLEQRFTSPQSSFTAYSGPATTNYSNYKTTKVFTYDGNSNLTGIKDEGNRTVANIYDYNDKYVVASVINADPVADKPAYTSFETSVLGGWTLTGTASYTTASFITGSRGFVLTSNTLSASLNTAKPYILSFWASNSGVTVTGGATLSKSGPSYLGMTYYEYSIAQGTSSVSVTGNSNIDELRVYPKTARMKTTTYDPLIGKTSECDENNRITYYAYDNLDRLQFVKDENGNVVKEYEYNNVSAAKQTGCTSSYSNNLISEIFTRSNCSTGYQGGTVTFTVPAGAYTSSVSQEDADTKAEMYLSANAQNYANANGSCSLIYYNTQQSRTATTQICDSGYKGGVVTYIVAAKAYSSIISQADADQKALDDINANAQYNANLELYAAPCVVDTAADYEAEDNAPTECQQSNGVNTGHQLILVTDVNPNSPTYNHTQWVDKGVNTSTCPAPSVYVKLSYENTVYAGAYEYQDIVVRFYSDAQCTIPISVSNLDVFYHYITYDEYGGELNEHDNDTYCSGNTYVLVHQAVTYYSLGAGNYEYTEYYLDPDPAGYYAPIQ